MTKRLFLGSVLAKTTPVFRGTPGYVPIPLDNTGECLDRNIESVCGKLLTDEIRHYITIVEAKLKWKSDRDKAKRILTAKNRLPRY